MQLDAFATAQLDGGQANRVRTARRPGRKHSMRPIVEGRRAEQIEPMRAIELPDDEEMREALDVGESRLKLRLNLQHTICLVLNAKAFGNFACVLVRTAHKSNWVRGEHRGKCLH